MNNIDGIIIQIKMLKQAYLLIIVFTLSNPLFVDKAYAVSPCGNLQSLYKIIIKEY